ncbi:MAG: class I tRNA ligase family protein, partial [Solirubrobacterales bacterium]|nr:class I tRNA ligase family protein [Solirubrobacterales bacterium]
MTPTDNSTPATRREAYDPHAIERRRQAAWSERNAFATPAVDDDGARHVYVKPSAPFTSGNIHIGHVRSYSIGDAYARFLRARGDAVLFAFGYDAFGLPAELGAIAQGISPSEWVAGCAEHMTGQLQRLGFSFDWARAFLSSDPVMYRWSQWLFLELLDAGLIYRAGGSVDWCDHCSTTLASIQVEHGTCWRCHGPVRLIQLPQWYLRISTYLEENDRRAAELEHWDDTALASQSYILGRVDGVEAELAGPDGRRLAVFTPHREHLRDARFVLISPRHPEIERWAGDPKVQDRLEEVRSGGWERSAREADTVPIVDTGHTLAHPLGAAPLPVLISPVVDSRFGVTAVLGIPAADRTDEVIARRLGLARDRAPDDGDSRHRTPGGGDPREGAAGEGDPFRPAVRYRAYDFSISRQRSWGTPIPIV